MTTTQHDNTPARRAEQVLGRIADLPGPPDASARILASADGDGFESRDAIALIEADQSLAPRALALAKLLCASSGKANGGADIGSLDDVMLLAGFGTLRAAVVACQLFDAFADRSGVSIEGEANDPGKAGLALDRRAFWISSVALASASEALASSRGVDPADAFLAGFAQGIGVVALDSILPSSFSRVAGFAEREGKDLAETERTIMGIDHHTVGRKVAERWLLPQCVRDAIWLAGVAPERVPETPNKPLVTTINLALTATRFAQLAWFGDAPTRESVTTLAAKCSVDASSIEGLDRAILGLVSERAEALRVPSASASELAEVSLRRARTELERQRSREAPRERLVERQKAALGAVSAFQTALPSNATIEDVAGAVMRSATDGLSAGFVAVCVQSADGGPAQVFVRENTGVRGVTIHPPAGAPTLREAFSDDRAPGPLSARAPWLAEAPALAQSGKTVLSCELPSGGQTFAAILLDKEPADAASLRPLMGAWGSALAVVSGAAAAEQARTKLDDAERKAEEARLALLEAEGLRSIASLATGAMSSFMAQVEMIRTRCEMLAPGLDKQRDQRWLEAIAFAGSNVGTLVQTLRLFAETPELQRSAVPLNWLLERAGREARGLYRHDPRRYPQPRPRIVAEPGLPNVLIDADQVIDAFAELILNGLESEKSEVVEIRAHIDHNTGRALIIVRDDGEGMPERDIAKAFDPYYTTKRKLRRLGLGLTRAKRLIELNAGEISLRADPGGGLAAAIFVPLAPPGMETQAKPEEDEESFEADVEMEA